MIGKTELTMPLDHSVPQVHLRNFYAPGQSYFYAIRKSDKVLRPFRTSSRTVCAAEDGSTNAYLAKERVIEDALQLVEPRYNKSVAKVRDNRIDHEAIQCISGFLAYVLSYTPTAMRLSVPVWRSNLEAAAKMLDRQGVLGKAPPSLGGKSMTELLNEGTVGFDVDPKYPQAVSTANFFAHVSTFGNSMWEVLHNGHDDSPFFTSDFPAALEETTAPRPLNRIIPLAPDLALRVIPDEQAPRRPPALTFPRFRVRHVELRRPQVRAVNKLIVQCAEDFVFFRDDREWVADFVKRHRRFRVDSTIAQVSHSGGFSTFGRLRIAPWSNEPGMPGAQRAA